MKPYTYLIGWKALDKWYYGVRYAKTCDPSDLWKTYFTSSKRVAAFRLIHGEPDVVEARRVFASRLDARRWEERVLDRVKAVRSDRWLNRQNHGKDFNNDHLIGVPVPREIIERRAASQRGMPKSAEHRMKISQNARGRVMTPAAVEANRKGQTGKVLSDAHKAAIRDGMDRTDPVHCAKISAGNKGKVRTAEQRKNYSAGAQNRSPEYREKLRQAALKRWHGSPST